MQIPVETGSNVVMAETTAPDIHKVDDSFDSNQSFKYQLGLIINEISFQCLVFDPEQSKYIAYAQWQFGESDNTSERIINYITNNSWLKQPYQSVKVGVVNDYATLIPESVFTSELVEETFELNFGRKENWEILADNMLHLGVRQIFGFPQSLRIALEKQYENLSFHHSSSAIFEYLFDKFSGSADTFIHLDVHKPFMSVCAFNNGKLLLANTLKFSSLSELVYQVLYAFKKLELNPEETVLNLSGDLLHSDAAFNELYKFVRNVAFIQNENEAVWANSLVNLDKHVLFNVTRLLRCEL